MQVTKNIKSLFKTTKKIKISIIVVVLAIIILIPCGYYLVNQQNKLRLAVPKNEYTYVRAAKQLQSILNQGGFKIELILTDTPLEAAEYVIDDKADLCFFMNKSFYIAESIGLKTSRLRTVLPLFRRSMFFYIKKDSRIAAISPGIDFRNKTIGVEVANGEAEIGLQHMLDMALVEPNYKFGYDSTCSIYNIWDENYSPKHLQMLANGWQCVSLDKNWIKFISINNPALLPITIPAIPDKAGSKEINTVYSETLLLASTNLSESAVLKLTEYIFQNKAHFISTDKMYATIDENYDKTNLLFAQHDGADAYSRRNNPSFLERYSGTLALFASFIAFSYATVISVRGRIRLSKLIQEELLVMKSER